MSGGRRKALKDELTLILGRTPTKSEMRAWKRKFSKVRRLNLR